MLQALRKKMALILMASWLIGAEAQAQQALPDSAVVDANASAGLGSVEHVTPQPPERTAKHIGRRTGNRLEPRIINAGASRPKAPWYTNGFVALSLVLILIGGAAWVCRRFASKGPLGNSAIEILGRTYLSSKQSLALIKVGDRVMLVGLTPDRIGHLATIDDPVGVDLVTARVAAELPERERFGKLLDSEAALFETEAALEEDIDRSDLRTVRQTRHELEDLLGKVKTLKNSARAGQIELTPTT